MLARQSKLSIKAEGVDITENLSSYVLSWKYTDNLDKLDELSLNLRGDRFINEWHFLKGEKIEADILTTNWNFEGDNRMLSCGRFTVDSDRFSGPPAVTEVAAVSVDINKNIKDEKKDKVWENVTLEKIAKEKANESGMRLIYEAEEVNFNRVEQLEESDLSLLFRLASQNGIVLKVINDMFVFFEEKTYEARKPAFEFDRNKGIKRYSFSSEDADTYDKSIVTFTDGMFGKTYEGTFIAPDREYYKSKKERLFKNNESGDVPGESIKEKEDYLCKRAQKKLREKNKWETTGTIEVPGDSKYQAGLTCIVKNFGKYDGTYIIVQVIHSGGSGYNCSLKLRKVLRY